MHLDLSFTGLTTIRAKDLLLYLTHMENLTCLGLRGNRLDYSCVEFLDQLMQKPERFPKLFWVDMRNNVDIHTYPKSLLEAFKERLPQGCKNTDMRDLAEGKAVFVEDDYDAAADEDNTEWLEWSSSSLPWSKMEVSSKLPTETTTANIKNFPLF